MAIEGYCSSTSVFPAEDIGFHVSAETAGEFGFTIRRLPSDEVVHSGSAPVGPQPVPEGANAVGCGWAASHTLTVPADWPSGVYRVDLQPSTERDEPDQLLPEAPEGFDPDVMNAFLAPPALYFVVKAREPASPILLALSYTTYQAYNHWPAPEWPGGSVYFSDGPTRSRKVSFLRPGGWSFYSVWEEKFVEWLRAEGMTCDFCTSVDLHRDPELLRRYQLLLSVGHDEYWSKEMRDHVEAFVSRGGNVAFFSGDVCQWQVRFEDDDTSIVCYKNSVEDPLNGVDDERVTVEWYASPVSRPENTLTGVSFAQRGAMFGPIIGGCDQQREDAAYEVRFPEHWAFESVDLSSDGSFGRAENIVGYETDACDFVEIDGVPRASGRDGTPESFVILATADLTKWRKCGKGGYATMGTYRRNGTVFTAATTDWSHGFARPDSAVHQITRNVVRRLSRRLTREWEPAGAAAGITSMTGMEGTIFGAGRDAGLWCREPTPQNVPWQRIGASDEIVAICSTEEISGQLFAVNTGGQLLCREPVTVDEPWGTAGDAGIDVVDMTATHYKLFAVADDRLWWREPIAEKAEWEQIDEAVGIVALASLRAAIFGVREDGVLLWRPPIGNHAASVSMETMGLVWRPTDSSKTPWREIGDAPEGIVALAVAGGRLFAATQEGRLWWREVG